ncbi:P-loop containing nucleoside triphosphate hydrolase protein [Lipomyces chichibuensis]|uniref:P-loop containing nucleoside triphosphate hydrolase protein n=1 Tax=Lipomyces chichibuensis TaxID=1546026 RepID=UPI003342E86A
MSTSPGTPSAAKRRSGTSKAELNSGKRQPSSLLQSSRPTKRMRKTSKLATISYNADDDASEILDASRLAWKPVTLPERVGDLEGLMGFEEIDGVDVEYVNVDGGNERIVKFKKAKISLKEEVKKSTKSMTKKETQKKSGKLENVDAVNELETELQDKHKHNKKKEKKKTVRVHKKADDAGIGKASNIFGALNSEEMEIELPEWVEVYPLSESLLHGLSELGFTKPTDIQRQAIPLLMAGHDLVGKAATGSGKTLAFGLAILEKYIASSASSEAVSSAKKDMSFSSAPSPTALIFAPTRELAHQITDHITKVSKFNAASVVSITGGLAIQKQRRLLSYFPDIVVATPGRLHELMTMDTEGLIRWLAGVEMLVLDEADRLLQDGHFKELDEILDMIGQNRDSDSESSDNENYDNSSSREQDKRQTLVFSATFEKDLTRKLTTNANNANGKKQKRKFVNNNIEGKKDTMAYLLDKLKFREGTPQYVDVNPDEAVKREIVEGVIMCDALEKDVYLYYFLLKYPGRTIVFVNSVDAVKRIARFLQELTIPALPFHSHMIQKQRLRTVERFKDNDRAVLISTDVAARGLDISRVQHVLHYHLPRSADMYIHRSGRTARGTEHGVAMILCARTETQQLKKMAQKLGKDVKELRVFDVEKKVVKQLEYRVSLAREINALESKSTAATAAKAANTKKKGSSGDMDSALWRQAAEDLGLEMSEAEEILAGSESDDDDAKSRQLSTKQKEQDRIEVQRLRKDLKAMISQPILTSSMVSRNYITSGLVNLAQQIVDGTGHETFLGETKTTALNDVSRSRRQWNKKPEKKK